jgi:uncharacterized protein (TIGR02452 family)
MRVSLLLVSKRWLRIMKSGSKKNSSGGVSFGGSSNTSGGASSSATSGPSFNRNQRAQVFVNTMEICAPNGPFGCLPPPEPSELYSHSDQKFSDIDRLRETAARERNYATNVQVVNEDVLVTAKNLRDNGAADILLLNLASFMHLGGGARTGAMAQEEELTRRSNYFLSEQSSMPFYPMRPMQCIYTNQVSVIKDKFYQQLSDPFPVSMLAVAAVRNPKLTDNKLSKRDYDITCGSIENIFKVALLKGHSTLLLGALGCGAYHNPPEEIVKIYNIYLQKYNHCFQTILFAVLSTKDDNFRVFDEGIIRLS